MANMSYDYTYTDPSGYTYKGQVVSDTTTSKYNYVSGQSYKSPSGGTYTISGPGVATTAPSGAVYQTSYTPPGGSTPQDSYHYDVKNNAYYNINTGYDHATGLYTPPGQTPVPAWSGIGLGNEYSYVNTAPTGSPPNYQTYGGGGSADVNLHPITPTAYDYQFVYADGSYYNGKVVDDGTYGYKVGQTIPQAGGTYTIYAQDQTAPAASARAGYDYVQLYHSATNGTNYPPSDIISGTPWYQKAVGYGGLGTEKDYVQLADGYHQFGPAGQASTNPPLAAIPLPT